MPHNSPTALPLVLVHGYKGAQLKDAVGRVVWLQLSHILNLSRPSLQLPMSWTPQGQERDQLTVGAPLSSIAFQPVHGPFLRWAQVSGRPFYTFSYDWRRCNLESTQLLLEFLESIRQRHHTSPQIVAHSMGGLVSYAAMHEAPELAQSVLCAGTPFKPGINLLEDIHAGTPLGFNRTLMDVKAHGCMTSVYCFFPTAPDDPRTLTAQGEPLGIDWYTPADWEKFQLGLFRLPLNDEERKQARLHLSHALKYARQFRDIVDQAPKDTTKWPPFGIITSRAHDTQWSLAQEAPSAKKGWGFTEAEMRPGDGRVLYQNMSPLVDVAGREWSTNAKHMVLLNQKDNTAKAVAAMAQL